MARDTVAAAKPWGDFHGYEFLGPAGAAGITFGLPVVIYLMTFLCNDIAGCPVPSVLHPSTLTIEKLRQEVGWPEDGVLGLASFKVTSAVLAYYLFSMILHRVLPGEEVTGTQLYTGGKLKYKFNAFSSSILTVVILLAGNIAQGADFPVWDFMWDNYLQILTVNVIISYVLATYVYIKSFSVKPGNSENRVIAAGGQSGNMLYDWFIGRELNPRVTLPVLGEFDIKIFCEARPGLLGWVLLDFAFMAHQYKTFGFLSDSIVLNTAFHFLYVFDSYWMESSMLTQMDITTDGFGFMLAFGDLAWVPFTYSLQARYLAVYPVSLGIYGCTGVLGVLSIGYYIFRASNNEKNRFRIDPTDPRVAHLTYLKTDSGSKLLTSGWWGMCRHPNYLGDWIMAWAYCLPTGIAGYLIQHASPTPMDGQQSSIDGGFVGGRPITAEVVQGEARGFAIPVTYFYVIYFAVLLIHRELRDEEKCKKKYGKDWEKYQKLVRYKIIPGIY